VQLAQPSELVGCTLVGHSLGRRRRGVRLGLFGPLVLVLPLPPPLTGVVGQTRSCRSAN
jgi:hypothetical protein